jgi:DNA-binding MarR family transcriptional regulator
MLSERAAGDLGHVAIHTAKALGSLRQAMPSIVPGLEAASYPVLFAVAHGDARVTTIAERIGSDVSTTSRQVAHLAALGYVDKVTDPADGRAQLVHLSTAGRDLMGALVAHRSRVFQQVLAGWSDADAEALTAYLSRLCDDIDLFRAALTQRRTDHITDPIQGH